MENNLYIIVNVNENSPDYLCYWSNIDGWTENKKSAETFTFDEMKKYNLPLFGEWHVIKKGWK